MTLRQEVQKLAAIARKELEEDAKYDDCEHRPMPTASDTEWAEEIESFTQTLNSQA